jgi:hypothetical protein
MRFVGAAGTSNTNSPPNILNFCLRPALVLILQESLDDTLGNIDVLLEDKAGTSEGLSTELRIKQAALNWQRKTQGGIYYQLTTDDILIRRYCGTFNDAVVVLLSDKLIHLAVMENYRIADIEYSLTAGSWLAVWKDGYFNTLLGAYSAGILTKNDIQAVIDTINTK